MPLAVFEPAIPASERLQTDALDVTDTGIGAINVYHVKMVIIRLRLTESWKASKLGNDMVIL